MNLKIVVAAFAAAILLFAMQVIPITDLLGGFAAIPLPAAGWMFLSALAGIGFLARRRAA